MPLVFTALAPYSVPNSVPVLVMVRPAWGCPAPLAKLCSTCSVYPAADGVSS